MKGATVGRRLLCLLFLAGLLLGLRPHSFVSPDARNERPASFFHQMENPPAYPAHINSFEFNTCANEVGYPAATVDETGTSLECESVTGVTDGSESMSLWTVPTGNYIHVRDAFDTTGEDPVYFQFTILFTGGIADVATHSAIVPTDGAASPTFLWPRFSLFKFGSAPASLLLISCDTTTGNVNNVEGQTTWLVQMDLTPTTTGTQYMRVYNNDTKALKLAVSCSNSVGSSDYKGLALGHVTGPAVGINAWIDDFRFGYTPFGTPH